MSVIADTEARDSSGWKQFVKFCVIGASSTVIDLSIAYAMIHVVGMPWQLAYTVSFAFAVTNGYIWNSLWTFRGMGATKRHTQYLKFVAVNLVGYLLNNLIMGALILLQTGHLHGNPPDRVLNIAKGVAIVLVASWNFLANKRWTFAEARV